jgi:predicted NUDIX family phosphoesterase
MPYRVPGATPVATLLSNNVDVGVDEEVDVVVGRSSSSLNFRGGRFANSSSPVGIRNTP